MEKLLMNLIFDQIVQDKSYKKYTHELNKALNEQKNSKTVLPIRFVIFTYPRSGSNLLCGMLNFHPQIICHHELFNPKKIYYSKDFHKIYGGDGETVWREALISGKKGIGTIRERNLFPEKFLVKVWQHNYDYDAVGFNLFPTHITNASVSLIKDEGVKKILLSRQNTVKSYVSLLLARKTGVWDSYDDNKRRKVKTTQVTVNAKRLLSWSRKYNQHFNSLRQNLVDSKQSFMDLAYEDLVSDKSKSVKIGLLEFLGVSNQLDYLQPPQRKQNANNLADLVSNYEELKEKLIGTELESLL
jgi:LPS sulfotransferase NodH